MALNTDLDTEDSDSTDTSTKGSVSSQLNQPRSPAQGWLSGWRGLAVGVGVGAAIAIVGTRIAPSTPSQPAPKPAETTSAPGQSVGVEPARMGAIAKTLSSTGTVDARDWVMVKAQATGLQIQQILVNEGQSVTAGQVIAKLDDSVLQSQQNQAKAQLASAQAQLNSARAQLTSAQAGVQQKQALLKQEQATLAEAESNLRRYQELARQGAETRQNLEARMTTVKTARESVNVAQSNIASAQADVGRAQADVSRAAADVQNSIAEVQKLQTQVGQTVVRAPVSGILAKTEKDSNGKPVKDVRVGDLTGTDPLFYIIGDGSLELRVKVPENALPQIKAGAPVQITSDADKRINLQAQVREVDPVVNEQTRQAIVKIDLPASSLLKPGMFLKASVTIQTAQAVTIPAQAVIPQTDGKPIVYVLEGQNTVRERSVDIGTRQNATDPSKARIEIKNGLKVGDRVIVAGAGFLKDGDHVTVVRK